MKDNNLSKRKILLLERVDKYCKQLGVTPIPKIVWNRNELKEVRPDKRRVSKNTLGECYFAEPLIYINYPRHKGLIQLDSTLRHELIHYRFTGIPHGKKFHKKMKELKAGMTWKDFDRNKWRDDFNKKWQNKTMEFKFRQFMTANNEWKNTVVI